MFPVPAPSSSEAAPSCSTSTGVPEALLTRAREQHAQLAQDALSEGDPPWRLLAESLSILEPALQLRMMAISKLGPDAFLAPLRSSPPSANFASKLRQCFLPTGHAALREDGELESLLFELVPTRCDELQFWWCYFQHCSEARLEVLPPTVAAADDDDWEDFLTSPLGDGPAACVPSVAAAAGPPVVVGPTPRILPRG